MIPLILPLIAACAPVKAPSVAVPPAVVLGRPYDANNPFARMIRGERTSPVVYEDKRLLAFMDYAPASPGHVLIISKRSKARNLLEMNDRDLKPAVALARRIGRAEMSGLGADGFTVEQNNAYSQSVPHLHVHVVPRYLGYPRCPQGGMRQPAAVLEPIAARLRTALADDKGLPVPSRPTDDLPPPARPVITPAQAVAGDTPADPTFPAALAAFQLPSHGARINAVFYLAAGAGPHPTLLLLHGFPGNEQNLDLAQAVRRTGWNVLTLHYRGSWGSEGAFSFAHAAEDAAAALAFLHTPEAATRYRVDAGRIVVAGHSMGGMMAARVGADDKAVIGTVLIDAWDIAGTGRAFADPRAKQAFAEGELRGDLPPLSGTGEAALLREIEQAPPTLDLAATGAQLADRPLLVISAERGLGTSTLAPAEAARRAGGKAVTTLSMPTDHSFSDHRIALTTAVVDWLQQLPH
ncbi:alpha/beta fold hydrolase [uncultured Sphingomonas sp.]|uniref:alpha/beta fold hydrolase n=1 Tax=uncultured Sphingomonas sp. TaxID=158754 RepID=UPI0025CD77D1|nr:alpha/beta fold hydrolase [uncultured Sphingomonas sp.]